jgi:5-carboxymethyl-2-hydroxymuconate isomerase
MPHILVEYSSNLEDKVSVRRLVDDLHKTMVDSGLFELSAIRTRALPRGVYRIADGKPENVFLHIITRIRSGRSVEDRKTLGNALLNAAKAALGADSRPIALGVEIHEIDPEMLFRHITIK